MRLQQMLSEPTEPATSLIGPTVVKQKLYFWEENVNISKQKITVVHIICQINTT